MLDIALLRLRNFRALMFTRVFITLALQAQAVIVGWQIYSITRDPFLLGLTGLAEAVPALLCALVSGHLVDVGRPHRIYRICVAVMALNTLVMVIIAGEYAGTPQSWIVPCLFIGVFISGIARSFVMPAGFSLLSSYVTRKEMPQAGAWLNTGFQTAAIGGPALAGIIYGQYGPHNAWLLPALALLAATLLSLTLSPHVRTDVPTREPAYQSIKNGWKFIFSQPVLLSVMALDMFAVLFGGAVAMLPAYADHVLHVGPEGLGALRAAPAIGSVAAALYMAIRPMRHLSGQLLLLVFAGFGLSIIGFGLSTSFFLSMFFLAASGVFDSINVVTRGSIVQLLTPPDMKGRVSSVNTMFIISSNEIGSFESGTAARLLGLVPSVVFGGLMSLGVVAFVAFFSPKLRKLSIDTHNDATDTAR